MNKRQFTGFMFLLCTCTAFAQQVEVKKDSIGRAVLLPPEQKQPLNMLHLTRYEYNAERQEANHSNG